MLYERNNLREKKIKTHGIQCIQTTKIDEIQITTTHSKKMINVKYNHTMIKQNKLNKAMILNFL